MLHRLGLEVTLCCVLTGETGRVLRHLLEEDGLTVVAVDREGRGPAYVHDRRDGQRREIAEEAATPSAGTSSTSSTDSPSARGCARS